MTYVAPRAARTGLISREVAQYADLTGMAIDEPDRVASQIVDGIERGKKDIYFGASESVFVKLNGVVPRLVDYFLANNDRKTSALFAPQNPSGEGTTS